MQGSNTFLTRRLDEASIEISGLKCEKIILSDNISSVEGNFEELRLSLDEKVWEASQAGAKSTYDFYNEVFARAQAQITDNQELLVKLLLFGQAKAKHQMLEGIRERRITDLEAEEESLVEDVDECQFMF